MAYCGQPSGSALRLKGDVENPSAEARTDRFLSVHTGFPDPFHCCWIFMLLQSEVLQVSDDQTSSIMGDGFAACGLTSARNLVLDSLISDRDCAIASSVRFIASST